MACRRHDRARLIGCHVGAVAIRGCCIRCCPYPRESYQEIINNERYTFDRPGCNNGEYVQSWRGRRPCINPYKPKFVCVDCRRCFKQTALDGNEYERSENGKILLVRPDRERVAHVWKAYSSLIRYGKIRHNLADQDLEQKEHLYVRELLEDRNTKDDEHTFTVEKVEELRQISPTFLWKSMLGKAHCPECGKEGRAVGGTFRPCTKTDDKGWKHIEEMLRSGVQFIFCMTSEEQSEAIREGRRLQQRRDGEDAWVVEKKRRIAESREASEAGMHMKLERQRLDMIRFNANSELSDEWVMIAAVASH